MTSFKTAKTTPASIGVMIATLRRPDALLCCLSFLEKQVLLPEDVLVIVRSDDLETPHALRERGPSHLKVRTVLVDVPGVVAARNAGLAVLTTDIVAIIDDDTAPRPEWLQRVMDDFVQDPQLGGLGGRDRCFGNGRFEDGQEAVVGKITWFGNVIGNHHLGFGSIREVDLLKGANMSFRAEAVERVRFDRRLKGRGAQPGEDAMFSVAVRNQGWKIAYDPAAILEHYAAERQEVRQYVGISAVTEAQPYWEFCYNQVLMVWYALPVFRRFIFFGWSCLVGSGVFPGLVQAVRFTPKLGIDAWRRFLIAQRAKIRAFYDLTFGKG